MPFSIVIIKRGMQTLHSTLKRFRLTGMMLMHYSHLKHLLINKKNAASMAIQQQYL